jgi:tRNA-binding EMAP/Myf-like protein
MAWEPEVTKVTKIEKHPNADSLDLVTIYHDLVAVSRKDQFKEGDLVSYIPVDTIPGDHPAFDFLGSERNKRIKAKRLRGEFSKGLLLEAPEGFKEGDSVIDYYKLTRYYSPFEKGEYLTKDDAVLGLDNGCNESTPKHFEIPYYDLDNASKFANLFENGEEVVINEKAHGCVDSETIISTLEYGDVKISFLFEEKPKNIHIKSFNVETNEIEYKLCEDYFNNGSSDDWYEVETESGKIIKITGNHMVWNAELNCYKPISEFVTGDSIIMD